MPEMEMGLWSMRLFLLLVANKMNSVFVGLMFRRCDDIHADISVMQFGDGVICVPEREIGL